MRYNSLIISNSVYNALRRYNAQPVAIIHVLNVRDKHYYIKVWMIECD